jgi:hypothetical protein
MRWHTQVPNYTAFANTARPAVHHPESMRLAVGRSPNLECSASIYPIDLPHTHQNTHLTASYHPNILALFMASLRGRGVAVTQQLPKLLSRVRVPSPALMNKPAR